MTKNSNGREKSSYRTIHCEIDIRKVYTYMSNNLEHLKLNGSAFFFHQFPYVGEKKADIFFKNLKPLRFIAANPHIFGGKNERKFCKRIVFFSPSNEQMKFECWSQINQDSRTSTQSDRQESEEEKKERNSETNIKQMYHDKMFSVWLFRCVVLSIKSSNSLKKWGKFFLLLLLFWFIDNHWEKNSGCPILTCTQRAGEYIVIVTFSIVFVHLCFFFMLNAHTWEQQTADEIRATKQTFYANLTRKSAA